FGAGREKSAFAKQDVEALFFHGRRGNDMINIVTTATLDCRTVAQGYFEWAAEQRRRLELDGCLATVLYRPRQNPASLQYRDLVHKDADRLGFSTRKVEADEEGALLDAINELNADSGVIGVMVFYPIRGRIPDEDIMDRVSPHKDIEGLHSINLGYLIKYKR